MVPKVVTNVDVVNEEIDSLDEESFKLSLSKAVVPNKILFLPYICFCFSVVGH